MNKLINSGIWNCFCDEILRIWSLPQSLTYRMTPQEPALLLHATPDYPADNHSDRTRAPGIADSYQPWYRPEAA